MSSNTLNNNKPFTKDELRRLKGIQTPELKRAVLNSIIRRGFNRSQLAREYGIEPRNFHAWLTNPQRKCQPSMMAALLRMIEDYNLTGGKENEE